LNSAGLDAAAYIRQLSPVLTPEQAGRSGSGLTPVTE
jgi:hypothetical protein